MRQAPEAAAVGGGALPLATLDAAPAAVIARTGAAAPVVPGGDLVLAGPSGAVAVAVAPRRGRFWLVRPLLACAAPLVAAVWLVRSWSTVRTGIDALASAHPFWLVGAVAVAQLTWVAGAACQQGTVPRSLPVRRLLAAQVAGSVANHVLPAGFGVGAVKLRFLHRHGFSLRESLTAVGLDATAGVTTHLAVLAVLLAGGFLPVDSTRLPDGGPVALGVAVAAAAVAVAALLGWLVPAARRVAHGVWARVVDQLRSMRSTIRSPSRAALLWGGSAAIPLLHAATLWAIMRALHLPLGVGAVFALYFAASAASALVPSPGGFGSLDAALTAAIIAAGQSPAVALAAVLGYRLVTVWLPMAPSACVLALMVRRGHL
ncbi:putative integral membrane protein [Frankia torreyi]|uniref:Putative integral membrane protein n=1 Tax=Frankia torreyi TaxID=1856 RepID=A0A0D8BEB7_9ACTN|nr:MULTISPECIES: lysylphosphatidylglycerol synthase transmembrane domain-containing protein [Frankia]KJE22541.1 putative integral membrane protein [Frankia torreyi]KQM04582.1 putative integral membrane protein [Frankia sp. CpI1-P]